MTQRLFLQGLVAGAFGTLMGGAALLYTLARLRLIRIHDTAISTPGAWLEWAYTNLGSSIPVFAGLLLAFFVTLGRLRRSLDDEGAIDKIVQLDQLTDIWTTLFFGTGVIWTAIGMRGALLEGLGDLNAQSAAKLGAFSILQRLVDGGILLALSTTIFGAVGGYFLRLVKSLTVGTEVKAFYNRMACQQADGVNAALQSIDTRLSQLVSRTAGAPPDDS